MSNLEAGNLLVTEVLLPVEAGRAVVSQQLAGVTCMNSICKFLGLLVVRRGGFHPEQVGMRSVCKAASNSSLQGSTVSYSALMTGSSFWFK